MPYPDYLLCRLLSNTTQNDAAILLQDGCSLRCRKNSLPGPLDLTLKQCIFPVPAQHGLNSTGMGPISSCKRSDDLAKRLIYLQRDISQTMSSTMFTCRHASAFCSWQKLNLVLCTLASITLNTFLGYFNLSAYFSQLFRHETQREGVKDLFLTCLNWHLPIFNLILCFRIPLDLT